jgi:hypothetical protein
MSATLETPRLILPGEDIRREPPKLFIPGENGDGAVLDLGGAQPSEYLRSRLILADDESALADWYLGQLLSGKSNYLSNKDLNHNFGKGAFTMPATVAIVLLTVVPTAASTGSSVTEAAYTGWARFKLEAASLNESTAQKLTNSAKLELAGCTGSSSTIVGFIIADSTVAASGNSLYWGTTASTVISTTQTPPTIAVNALEATES